MLQNCIYYLKEFQAWSNLLNEPCFYPSNLLLIFNWISYPNKSNKIIYFYLLKLIGSLSKFVSCCPKMELFNGCKIWNVFDMNNRKNLLDFKKNYVTITHCLSRSGPRIKTSQILLNVYHSIIFSSCMKSLCLNKAFVRICTFLKFLN